MPKPSPPSTSGKTKVTKALFVVSTAALLKLAIATMTNPIASSTCGFTWKRLKRMSVTGVATMIASARVKIDSPESVAVKLRRFCWNCGARTTPPKSPKASVICSREPTASVRFENKMRTSTIGLRTIRSSHQTNAAREESASIAVIRIFWSLSQS